MESIGGNSDIAHIIQLVIAPVFLLTAVSGLLNVVASRLARVVDRVRSLELDVPNADEAVRVQEIEELQILDRRIRLCHLSIGLCTASALLVCLVVILLFVVSLQAMNFAVPVSLLFIVAMLCLTAGLMLFLTEVTIATRSVRVSEQYVTRGARR
jgi:high-affinity Fe2+/Pb2+ permease